MALYRTYKNGLYAKKYKGYYIVPPKDVENKTWKLLDLELNEVKSGIPSYYDAVWETDKLAADDDETRTIYLLFQKSIPELENIMTDLNDEKQRNGLSQAEEIVMDYTLKVINRKKEKKGL